jgi:NADH:ubiquinone oxidoreductase subunit 5 (subunit L)/multisubunit Na+/H+ antiporter MnhA subunit
LLIAFWRDRPGTLRAGLEALAANAVGDAALLLAVALVPTGCGALTTLHTPACTAGVGGAGLLAWLLVVAASAKSAQGPLYFWLPSAMAGPTPVSALLHSATMVAAGAYLLARVSPLLALAPDVLAVTAWVGVLTALLGGLASLFQGNLKRGIAYSTVSQLGYMFAAVGLGAPFAAFFHLLSQAMFKALLFLSAGVVIHARGGEERLTRLGGLRTVLPVAYVTFLIGALSLIGFPGTAGSFSKDLIIEVGLEHNPPIGGLLLLGALITGLYIGRLFFGTFYGSGAGTGGQGPGAVELGQLDGGHAAHATLTGVEREPPRDHHGVDRPHEPAVMTWPLWPLAAGALLLGYLEWPGGGLSRLLQPVLGHVEQVHFISLLGLVTGVLGLAGFLLAGWWLQTRRIAAERPERGGWVDWAAEAGSALASGLAGLHGGHLTRYAFASVLGLAILLLVGLRT